MLTAMPDAPVFDDNACKSIYEECHAWLQEVSNNTNELHQFVQHTKAYRLGRYFEALMSFWLKNCPHFEPLLENQQIFLNKKSIGELDYIFKYKEQIYHFEIAVKFYLGIEPGNAWHHWLGPGLKDRLDLKLDKLVNNQIPLCHHPQTQIIFKKNNISTPKSFVFLKGYLFWPLEQQQLPTPNYINSNVLKGYWGYLNSWTEYLASNINDKWMILPKLRWLSPALAAPAELKTKLEIQNDLAKHFANSQRPVQIAHLRQINENNWIEQQRIFVVPDLWPYF